MNSAYKLKMYLYIILFIGLGLFSAFAESSKQELATLQVEVERLSRENQKLKESLVASKINHHASTLMLSKAKSRLALHQGEISNFTCYEQQDILLQRIAVLEGKVKDTLWQLSSLHEAADKFSSTAVSNDLSHLNLLESSLKSSLPLLYPDDFVKKSSPNTLQNSRVVSIDQESGLFVLNVGTINDAQLGMVFDITRGTLKIASAVIVDTRENISGLLTQQLAQKDLLIELGDQATLAYIN